MSAMCQKRTSIPNQDFYRDLTGQAAPLAFPLL